MLICIWRKHLFHNLLFMYADCFISIYNMHVHLVVSISYNFMLHQNLFVLADTQLLCINEISYNFCYLFAFLSFYIFKNKKRKNQNVYNCIKFVATNLYSVEIFEEVYDESDALSVFLDEVHRKF